MKNIRYRIWLGRMLAAGLAVSFPAGIGVITAYAAPEYVTAYAVIQNQPDSTDVRQITGAVPLVPAVGQTVSAGSVEVPAAPVTGQTASAGVQAPPDQTVSAGFQAPSGQAAFAGFQAPSDQTVSAGTQAPSDQTVSVGTQAPSGQTASAGTQTAPSGQTSTGTITAGQTLYQTPGPSAGSITTEGEKSSPPHDAILGGATLTMFNSQSESQMLSIILQTSQGSLIVVDGGLGADGDYLRSQIQARGGHVAAWLITHPHGDHAGALYKILQDEAAGYASGITIDGIYYSFAAPEWYTVHDPSEVTMAHSIIGTFAGLPGTMLHQVTRGQTIQVDDVTIQVMNDRYELGSDKGNNAGIVYKAYVNGKSILFLGDMAEEGGNRLLAEVGAEGLKSDIVQMAHHGQNGVSEAVYQAISPSICLWPTPQWLWDNSGARYTIPSTKSWMSRLGVQYHYCMKDGDQVIR